MMKPVVLAVAASVLVLASRADAQGRFQTGQLSWTPVITLHDAGLDTNVYDEPTNPKRDHMAVVTPQVDGVLELGAGSLRMAGSADFVYFRRYTDERSINGRGSVRLEIPLSRIRPFGGISYIDTRERQNSEIDLRARRTDREVTAGLGLSVTSRASVEVAGRRSDARFREGEVFRGIELARRFNRDTTGGTARIRYNVTPLTTFTIEADASRDHFVLSPDFDSDNFRANAGFQFAPDAVLKGRALIGYHKLDPRGTAAAGYEGLIASVELGYVLMGRTRFDVRVLRDTSYSLEAQPFFVQTTYGGEVLHNLFGPIDVIARASREALAYPDLPERLLTAHTVDVNRYGGGVAIRAAERVRMTLNYEFSERLGAALPDRHYERERFYTTVTYGF
jgi:hypothetical protein